MNERFKGVLSRGRDLALVAATAVPAVAFAQEAGDAFADAVTDATAKIGQYGAALIGLAAVGVVFMIGVKYVKKIRGAA